MRPQPDRQANGRQGREARWPPHPFKICGLLVFFLCACHAAYAHPVQYNIDQSTATISFSTHVAHVVPIDGSFKRFTAQIRFDSDKPTAVHIDVIVDDRAISVPFGGAETLQSPSYFDAPSFPYITFRSDSVQSLPDDRFSISGNLTIRNISRPQVLSGTLSHVMVRGVSAIHFVLHSRLDRTAFGMLKDRPLIEDEVSLTITANLRSP